MEMFGKGLLLMFLCQKRFLYMDLESKIEDLYLVLFLLVLFLLFRYRLMLRIQILRRLGLIISWYLF